MQLNRRQDIEAHAKTAPANSGSLVSSCRLQDVGELVCSIVDSYRVKLAPKNINLETDFDDIRAAINPDLVRVVTTALLDNAANTMAGGGEISVTLIDGKHQWELEIADSLGIYEHPVIDKPGAERSDLPTILPFPESDSLRLAHRAAMAHCGHIQTWSCPQGGTAHVFVVSRQPSLSDKQ